MIWKYVKGIIVLTWALLLGLLATRELFVPELDTREATLLRQAEQERFYGIWFDNVRTGYVAETLRPAGQGYALEQEAHLRLNVLQTSQVIDMRIRAGLGRDLTLQDFHFEFRSPFYTMTARGEVTGNTVFFRLDTGQAVIQDQVTLSRPPLLAINDRAYLLERLTSPGQKVKVSSFDPVSLAGRDTIITYHGQEKILIRKRLKQLHHFSQKLSGMRINFWLDTKGRVIKEESPAGFQFIAEPEFRARDIADTGNELLSAVSVPRRGPLPGPGARQISYRLTLPPDIDFDLAGGRQSWDGDLLTVTREDFSGTGGAALRNECRAGSFLEPSPYVQANHKAIRSQAESIVGDGDDTRTRVRRLAAWVYTALDKRPVIGLPDALTTLKTRQGDCNEHASLFAALARSIGIPTVIATGVTLQNNAFYYHAWNEVCLDGTWYSLDTTSNQVPADLFHIRFARGDMDQQLKIGALLGKLLIEILPRQDQP